MSVTLIAGLGNPGREYAGTRHNLGFTVVDALAAAEKLAWKSEPRFEALVARSPLFDAVFALATAPDQAPVGTIHPEAARALGVERLAVLAIRPDRHIGLIREGGSLADVEAYATLVSG